jgi:AcrR family transcriptional regulator
MKSSTVPVKREGPSEGRINQKRRTRQALMEAALALSESGHRPTLPEVAEKALVSRATAYRYFPSVEALVHEAYLEHVVRAMEQTFVLSEDPVESIGAAAEAVNRLLLQDEVGTHVIERAFMQVWLDNAEDARPPRAGRRMKFIDSALEKLAGRLDRDALARLRTALTLVIGVEAVISMRDVGGAGVEEAIEASRWAARAMVAQAIAEASNRNRDRRGRAAPRAR